MFSHSSSSVVSNGAVSASHPEYVLIRVDGAEEPVTYLFPVAKGSVEFLLQQAQTPMEKRVGYNPNACKSWKMREDEDDDAPESLSADPLVDLVKREGEAIDDNTFVRVHGDYVDLSKYRILGHLHIKEGEHASSIYVSDSLADSSHNPDPAKRGRVLLMIWNEWKDEYAQHLIWLDQFEGLFGTDHDKCLAWIKEQCQTDSPLLNDTDDPFDAELYPTLLQKKISSQSTEVGLASNFVSKEDHAECKHGDFKLCGCDVEEYEGIEVYNDLRGCDKLLGYICFNELLQPEVFEESLKEMVNRESEWQQANSTISVQHP